MVKPTSFFYPIISINSQPVYGAFQYFPVNKVLTLLLICSILSSESKTRKEVDEMYDFHPQTIERLNGIIEYSLERYTGGTRFFDFVDEEVRHYHPFFVELIEKARSLGALSIVMSGRFGRTVFNADYADYAPNLLLVNGNLRHGNPVDNLSYLNLKGQDFWFVDDSFYSGTTRDAIKAEIERQGGRLVGTVVAYDGSKVKDPTVHSMYRYYDNHGKD